MNRRRFLQLSSGVLGSSLMPVVLGAEVAERVLSHGPVTDFSDRIGDPSGSR